MFLTLLVHKFNKTKAILKVCCTMLCVATKILAANPAEVFLCYASLVSH